MSYASQSQILIELRVDERVEPRSSRQRLHVAIYYLEFAADGTAFGTFDEQSILLDGRENAHFLCDLGMSLAEQDREIDDAGIGILQHLDHRHDAVLDLIDAFGLFNRASQDTFWTEVIVLHANKK